MFVGPLAGAAIALALFGLGPLELLVLTTFVAVLIVGLLRVLYNFGIDWRTYLPAGIDGGDDDPAVVGGTASGSSTPEHFPQLEDLVPREHIDGSAAWLAS